MNKLKNKKLSIISALLCVTMLLTCSMFGTVAKYTSTITGTSVAKTAKWNFNVGDGNTITGRFNFNLFETIYDTDGTVEDDVASGLIAPGTKGSFGIDIENTSQVNATYKAQFRAVQSNLPDDGTGRTVAIPIEYSLTGTGDWVTDIEELNTEDIAIGYESGENTGSQTLYWRWSYNPTVAGHDDSLDTLLGMHSALTGQVPQVTVYAQIVATQAE